MCVTTVLALKNIIYEYKAVDLVKDGGEQHADNYKRLNPFSLVPTLVVNKNGEQVALFESMAIIDYLENAYPGPSVYPQDAIDRSRAIAIAQTIVSNIQPMQNLAQLFYLEKLGVDKQSYAKDLITQKYNKLEQFLRPISGKYCIGDSITIADVCLIPQTYNAVRYGVEIDNFPTIKKIVDNLEKIEAFKIAHPSNQPDAK